MSIIGGYPIIPLNPSTQNNTPAGGYNGINNIAIGRNNAAINSSEYAMILSGHNISLEASPNTVIISATNRPFDESGIGKRIYLRSDQGVYIEDPNQPDHFINLTEELSQTRQELEELKELVNQLYYAPGAPGYVEAQSDFQFRQSQANPQSNQ